MMSAGRTASTSLVSRLWRQRRSSAPGGAPAQATSDQDLPRLDPVPFRVAQIEALYSTLPLFVLSHVIVSATFAAIAANRLHLDATRWWFALSYVPAALLIVLWVMHDRQKVPARRATEIRWIEVLAFFFGLVWAACPVVFFAEADANLRVLVVTMTLAASAVGTFAFSRVPSAAILFCFLITSALALSGTILGNSLGVTFCIYVATYGFVLAGMVLNLHRNQQHQALNLQELERQKEIIALLLNDFELGTSDWLWECDANFRITYASPRFTEVLGMSRDQTRGLTLQELAGTQAGHAGWDHLDEKMASHEPLVACTVEVEIENLLRRWQISARPLFDAESHFAGYRGVGRDVTAEWETDRRLIEAKEAAETASSAKTHFLAVMSHELRTPLNSIIGFSEILASRDEAPTQNHLTQEYARTILDSSKHLQTLINDILDATRIENGSFVLLEQESDAAELIEIAVRMCRDQAEKSDVTLVARLLDNVEINVDMTRVKQVVLNLLTNAIKFSTAGGIVNVELVRDANDDLSLYVRDGGIGIREEDQARIFEPFVQAEDGMSRRFAGIGLGLSIALRIARLHGGNITLDSRYGEGTTMRFTLPAARVKWPAPRAAASAGVAA
jgi:signal transduction histidine kinase